MRTELLKVGKVTFSVYSTRDEREAEERGIVPGWLYANRIVTTGTAGDPAMVRQVADGAGFRRRRDLIDALEEEARVP